MNTHEPGADGAQSDVDQQALDWYVRTRNGLTPEQRQALHQWLQHSAHQAAYARWDSDWQHMDALTPAAVASLRQGWHTAAPPPDLRRRRWLLGSVGLATCTTLAVITAKNLWQAPWDTQEIVSASGQTRSMPIPGGGSLELDTMTRLTMTQYADRLELHLLQGQAWFDLAHNAERPAQILAGTARMTAHGAVSVRHTPEQAGYERVHIAVATGQAQLWQASAWRDWLPATGVPATDWLRRHTLRLAAGQQAWHGTAAQWRVQQVALSDVAPWRQDRLVVDDMPLAQVLAEFARYGHAVPRVAESRVARMRITGSFRLSEPDTLYWLLPQILPVRIEAGAAGDVIVMALGA